MKKSGKRIFKKTLAMLIALSMTVTMLPETLLYARAEEASAVENAEVVTEETDAVENAAGESVTEESENSEIGETVSTANVAETVTEETNTVRGVEVLASEGNAAGEVSNIEINWYSAFRGYMYVYFTPVEGAESISGTLVQYNAAGEILSENDLYYHSYSSNPYFSDSFYPYQDMVRMEFKVDATLNGEAVNSVYQVFERTNTPHIVFAAGTPQIGQTSMRTVVTVEESNLEDFNDFYECEMDAIVQYAQKDSEEWQYTSASSFYFYSWNKDINESIALDGLEAATSYKAKLILYAPGDGYSYDPDDCAFLQEIDLGEFTTAENPTPSAGFKNLKVRFDGFYAYVTGTYETSADVENVSFYLIQYNDKGEEIYSSQEIDVYSNTEGYEFEKYYGYLLHSDTRKVSVKAAERYYGQSAGDESMEQESDVFSRDVIPDIKFAAGNIEAGVSSINIPVSYTGDMALNTENSYVSIQADLICTEKGSTVSGTRSDSLDYDNDVSREKLLAFSNLQPGTTYTATLKLYVADDYKGLTAFEQEIALPEFTTKENKTYVPVEIFPDEAFRTMVLSRANLSSDAAEITAAQLERVTYITGSRYSFNTKAVKSLEGIEYLTMLDSLSLQNHEISDVSSIDWSKLTNLESLNLYANDLTEIPDLSQNKYLTYVSLEYNMIPAEEFSKVSAKLPAGVTLSSDTYTTQRVSGLQIVTEDTYYQRNGLSPLLVKITGYKTGLPYTFKYIVDEDTEAELEVTLSNRSSDIRYATDTGISLGSHTLSIYMYAGEELAESRETEFVMAEGGVYAGMPKYYYSNKDTRLNSLYVYSEKRAKAVYLKKGSTILAQVLSPSSYQNFHEYRYQKLSNHGIYMSGTYDYEIYASMDVLKVRGLDAGTYDVVLTYEDGAEDVLPDLVVILSSAFITDVEIGYDYDSTGDYIYLSLEGNGFDPSRLSYTFTDAAGNVQSASYVNAKETYSGYVVKFRKSKDWTPKRGDRVQLKLAAKPGYEAVFENDTFSLHFNDGAYYCAYNEAVNRLEVGIAADFKDDNLIFRFGRCDDWDEIVEEIDVICEVSDTIYYLTPMKDGVSYTLPTGDYKLEVENDGTVSTYSFWVYSYSSGYSHDYWSGNSTILEGTDSYSFYYFSSARYDAEDAANYTAELTGAGLNTPQAAENVWTYNRGDMSTGIGMTFKLSKLAVGNYTIKLYYKGELFSQYTTRIISKDKFIITDSPRATWLDANSFRVDVSTLNVANTDNYTVTLTDIYGNQVSGLKTEVSQRYSNSVYLKVTGLKQEDAYRYYYLRVEHKKLGEPYQADGETKYYTDEKGIYTLFSTHAAYGWYGYNYRVVGVAMYDQVAFPVTLTVYRPYDTEEIVSVTINKSDLTSGVYYFKQSLIDALPDPDAIYNIVLVDKNGLTEVNRDVIGLSASEQSSWTVSPSALTLNLGSETSESATITVSGNKATPTFKSNNSDVATVRASSDNKNQAIVTAVGKGSTTISVTADGKTRTVAVTVTREPVKAESFAIRAGSSTIRTGASTTVSADIKPAEAWTADSSITYTSSDSNVVEAAASTGKTCNITGKNPGTATITAVLHSADGTELSAECEITVVGVISGDEQDELVGSIGELYFLEGTDKSLADLTLPEGWIWSDPAEAPVADNALPVQFFDAVYSREGYAPLSTRLPVRVSAFTGIDIKCDPYVVLNGEQITVSGVYEYVGYDPAEYGIEYKWTVGPNMNIVSGAQTRQAVVQVSGSDSVKLEMVMTNPRTGKETSRTAELSVNVLDMVIEPAQTQPAGAMDISGEYLVEKSNTLIRIDGAAYDKKNSSKLALAISGTSATDVKWASSDASVMAVDKNGIVTVKKPGVAVIMATAGSQTGELEIRVEDYTPVLENKSVTVYQYDENLTPIGLIAQNGNGIETVTVKGAAGTAETAAKLAVEQSDDGVWCLGATNYTAKKTENITLLVTTKDGRTTELALKVVVDVTSPDAKTIKFKQTVKPNIFYCGDEAINAEFTVSSSKYVIENIFTKSAEGDSAAANRYVVESYDPATGKLVLAAEGLSRETLEAYNFTTEVYVKVQGYEEVPLSIKVGTQNKKPSLKLGDATFISGVTSAEVNLYSGKTIVDTDGMTFANVTLSGVELTEQNGRVSVDCPGSKSGSYKTTVSKDTWTSDVTVSGKVSVVDAKKLALEASVSKITINTNEGCNEPVTVSVAVKGNSAIPVTLNATETKNTLTIVEESLDTFEISAPVGAKKGSYKVKITGTVNGVAVKPVTVTVTLTDKTPEVKVSAKGSINLANRAGTFIVYTPSVKNLPESLSVEDVQLDTESSRLFSADLEGGKVVVKAFNGTKIRAKQKYSVNMTFILNNGMEVTTAKAVTITPVDKLPKVKVANISTNLYKTDSSHEARYQLRLDNGYTISRLIVEPDKKGLYQNFDVTLNEDNTVSVNLNRKDLKAGTYNLTCQVIIAEADNSKPVKVKLKVVVK